MLSAPPRDNQPLPDPGIEGVNNTLDRYNTVPNIFHPYLSDLLLIFREIYEKYSNLVNFLTRKMYLFLNGSEFRQKLIATIIRVLV